VRQLITGIDPDGDLRLAGEVSRALTTYAQVLTPWAEAVAGQMIAQVAQSNWNQWDQWMNHSRDISRALKHEIEFAPTGVTLRALQAEQVKLIKSLPLDAAERVQDLALGNLYSGERADVLRKHLLETSEITENRAKLIARTETSRVHTNLIKARAEYAGSVGFIWRTSRDGDVRHSHKEQEGKFFQWDNPPKTDAGLAPYVAGAGPNCRCWPQPVWPDDDD